MRLVVFVHTVAGAGLGGKQSGGGVCREGVRRKLSAGKTSACAGRERAKFLKFFGCGAGLNFAGARGEADKYFNLRRSLVCIGVGAGIFFGVRRHLSRIFPKLPEKLFCSKLSQKNRRHFWRSQFWKIETVPGNFYFAIRGKNTAGDFSIWRSRLVKLVMWLGQHACITLCSLSRDIKTINKNLNPSVNWFPTKIRLATLHLQLLLHC